MKNAIVTGASTGIGRAVSIELAKKGYTVYLVARRSDELEKTKQMIEAAGGEAHSLPADLSTPAGVSTLLSDIREKNLAVHLLANIAGIWHGSEDVYAGKDFETFDQQVILDTFAVGTIAPTLLAHGLLPRMEKRSKIINLSGTFENGAKGWLPYYVSKRAIEDLTVGLAQELADKEIQVNCISPSDTATDAYAKFFPQYMDEAIDPSEIALQFVELSDPENLTTGKIIVLKKGNEPTEHFHF